jgi:hypothetical protein
MPLDAKIEEALVPASKKFHIDKRAADVAETGGSDDDMLSTVQMAAWLGVSQQWLEGARLDRLVRHRPARGSAAIFANILSAEN